MTTQTGPSETNQDKMILWEFEKDHCRIVRFSLREYNGHPFADLRVYWRNETSPDWTPGKQGVTVPIFRLPELRDAIDRAISENEESTAEG